MRHLFCVIRIGEPALYRYGTPTPMHLGARKRPRHHKAVRATGTHSRQAGNHDYDEHIRKAPDTPAGALIITSGRGIPATDEAQAHRREACMRAAAQTETHHGAKQAGHNEKDSKSQFQATRRSDLPHSHNKQMQSYRLTTPMEARQL